MHAYDTYTSTLLVRLLEWLGALGAPTVLLSATLPAKRRHELLRHYSKGAGWQLSLIDDQPYPRLTYVSEEVSGCVHVALTAKARSLALKWVDGALPRQDAFTFPLAENLIEVLRDGGCVAVVCNTVHRAQQMYCALETAFARLPDRDRPELHLFHAQLLQQDRQKREQFVLRVFGPGKEGQQNPSRPHRAVLVATQVIEQSLDLDFDLVVSDLARSTCCCSALGVHIATRRTMPHVLSRFRHPSLGVSAGRTF